MAPSVNYFAGGTRLFPNEIIHPYRWSGELGAYVFLFFQEKSNGF
jgi:hypothetical protein